MYALFNAIGGVVLAILLAVFLLTTFALKAPGQALPGGYAGRPPVAQSYPGRCWCAFHGPRGGCKRWVCKRTK